MGVNDRVFASNAERNNFYHLSRQWGNDFRLYHNLPFLNVFNTENLRLIDILSDSVIPQIENVRVNDIQFSRLKKTSIDYTLCDHNDKPIVCIEFDGLCDGHNVATHYVTESTPEKWRQTITELKLRIAHASSFPFFVVGYYEFREFSDTIRLAIIDGIVGNVISEAAARDAQATGFSPDKIGLTYEQFESLPQDEKVEQIGEWFEDCELLAKYDHNPIFQRSAELYDRLRPTVSLQCLEKCDRDDSRHLVGRTCTVEARGQRSTAQVWMPHFRTPGIYNSFELCGKIAQLIAMDKLDSILMAK